jgi:hypothetical protein
MGQNPKNSNRVFVFRCSSNNGHLDVLPCRLQDWGTEAVRRIPGKAMFSITAQMDGTVFRLPTAQSFQMTDGVQLKLRQRANII